MAHFNPTFHTASGALATGGIRYNLGEIPVQPVIQSEHIAIPSKQRRLSRPNTIEEIRQKRRKRNKQQREKNKKMSKTEKRYKIGHKMQHKLLEQGNTIQKLTVRVQKERKRAVDFWRLWDKEKMLRSMSNM